MFARIDFLLPPTHIANTGNERKSDERPERGRASREAEVGIRVVVGTEEYNRTLRAHRKIESRMALSIAYNITSHMWIKGCLSTLACVCVPLRFMYNCFVMWDFEGQIFYAFRSRSKLVVMNFPINFPTQNKTIVE